MQLALLGNKREYKFERIEFVPAATNHGLSAPTGKHPSGRKKKIRTSAELATKGKDASDPSQYKSASPESKVALQWRSIRPVGAGLHNLGNTCFMNSVLQALCHTAPFAELCLMNSPLPGAQRQNLVCCIQGHFQKALRKRGADGQAIESLRPASPFAPTMLAKGLTKVNKRFRNGRQEDAHEYLLCLLDYMHEAHRHMEKRVTSSGPPDVRNSRGTDLQANSFIHSIFGGRSRSQIEWQEHEKKNKSMNRCRCRTLRQALDKHHSSEILDGNNKYRCPLNNKLVPARRSLFIQEPPNVLIIHLKRFEFAVFGKKVARHIEFQPSLNLSKYLHHSAPSGSHEYDLVSVIVHHGSSTSSGHYIAYVKSAGGQWYIADDSRVASVRIEQVLKQQAYILMYVRREPRCWRLQGAASAAASHAAAGGPVKGRKVAQMHVGSAGNKLKKVVRDADKRKLGTSDDETKGETEETPLMQLKPDPAAHVHETERWDASKEATATAATPVAPDRSEDHALAALSAPQPSLISGVQKATQESPAPALAHPTTEQTAPQAVAPAGVPIAFDDTPFAACPSPRATLAGWVGGEPSPHTTQRTSKRLCVPGSLIGGRSSKALETMRAHLRCTRSVRPVVNDELFTGTDCLVAVGAQRSRRANTHQASEPAAGLSVQPQLQSDKDGGGKTDSYKADTAPLRRRPRRIRPVAEGAAHDSARAPGACLSSKRARTSEPAENDNCVDGTVHSAAHPSRQLPNGESGKDANSSSQQDAAGVNSTVLPVGAPGGAADEPTVAAGGTEKKEDAEMSDVQPCVAVRQLTPGCVGGGSSSGRSSESLAKILGVGVPKGAFGVGTWGDGDGADRQAESGTVSDAQRKRRIPDEHDEEYDRGKIKKVRNNKHTRMLGPGKEKILQVQQSGKGPVESSGRLSSGSQTGRGQPWRSSGKRNFKSSGRVRGGNMRSSGRGLKVR